MRTSAIKTMESITIPDQVPPGTILRLMPNDPDPAYYAERTDRNLGWITRREQEILRRSIVCIAGTGGMGGLLGSLFVRAGVGEIRIADSETFDASNVNRQYAATRASIGYSKALETARMIRAVSDDSTIEVYPQGITEDTADRFLEGASVGCDEIELLALDARILLHERARAAGVSLFNCNTVGFSTNLFLYTPESMTMEEAVGVGYPEAKRLRSLAEAGDAEARRQIAERIIRAVIPEIPEYAPASDELSGAFLRRVHEERKAPIIATNPAMAGGFLADRVLLHLLRNSGTVRPCTQTPPMPAYLHFDAALMRARTVDPWPLKVPA